MHGVIHHFYQIHLAAPPGGGPDYGHFVSKDFVHWAHMPISIWNDHPYDEHAIYTGSATVVDGKEELHSDYSNFMKLLALLIGMLDGQVYGNVIMV